MIVGRLKLRVGSRFVISYRYHGVPKGFTGSNRVVVCLLKGLKRLSNQDLDNRKYNFYDMDYATYFGMVLKHGAVTNVKKFLKL